MLLLFFWRCKSVFQLARRISAPYFARGYIFCNNRTCCDDSPLAYPNACKDNSPMANPYIIANHSFVV